VLARSSSDTCFMSCNSIYDSAHTHTHGSSSPVSSTNLTTATQHTQQIDRISIEHVEFMKHYINLAAVQLTDNKIQSMSVESEQSLLVDGRAP